jgi:hypothetical protein
MAKENRNYAYLAIDGIDNCVKVVEKENRGRGLYAADRLTGVKRSEETPLMMSLYQVILRGRLHEPLHVDYSGKNRKGVSNA